MGLLLIQSLSPLPTKSRGGRVRLVQFHQLFGLLPICANCKKIRGESGAWNPLESYISQHSEADFTHSATRAASRRCARITNCLRNRFGGAPSRPAVQL